MSLAAHRIAWHQDGKLILDGISVTVARGGVLGLIGPNGSGKSSLLRLLAGLRNPATGSITLDGRVLGQLGRRQFARLVALVEQHTATDVDIDVQGIVELGRTPHCSIFGASGHEDRKIVERALEQTGLTAMRTRRWHSLSGGERQRVQIARALAQQPTVLLLDEPSNHLDIQHQLELLQLVRTLPLTCVMALHDLNLAAMFCDQLIMLQGGRVAARGTPEQVLTESQILKVYGVKANVEQDQGHVHIKYRL